MLSDFFGSSGISLGVLVASLSRPAVVDCGHFSVVRRKAYLLRIIHIAVLLRHRTRIVGCEEREIHKEGLIIRIPVYVFDR